MTDTIHERAPIDAARADGIGGGRAAGRAHLAAGSSGRVQLQVRHRPGPDAPRQRPRRRGAEPHPGSFQRPPRHEAVSRQPARLRHGPAEPGAQRRRRVLQSRDVHPEHARSVRRSPQHRLRLRRRRCVWKAVDGPLGKYIADQIAKVGLVSVAPLWSNGFRQITSSTRDIIAPADLKGFKIRVPPAPILTSLFQALTASPTPINFNELYSALQTKSGGRAGEPARHHRHDQALRGAEVAEPDEPRLGRLPDPRQSPRLGQAAAGPQGHRRSRARCFGQAGACRHQSS